MRILIWHPIFVLGGGYQILRNMAVALARHPQVTSVTAAINREYDDTFVDFLRKNNVRVVRPGGKDHVSKFTDDVDVVYVPWPHGTPVPATDKPTVGVYQDTILLDAYGGHTTQHFIDQMKQQLQITCEGYTRLIVTSHYTKRRICKLLGESVGHKICVLPHIATEPVAAKPRAMKDEKESPFGPYLIYPANIAEHKNHITLFQSLSRRLRKDVKLLLCGLGTEQFSTPNLGDNAYVNSVNKTIEDRCLVRNDDFVALGYVDDDEVAELLNNSIGLIMPTRAEGMGLPIHEALLRHSPVIASDLPVLREHYEGRSEAIVWVDQECPSVLAQAWDYVCDHQRELREKAAHNNCSGIGWSGIGDKSVEIFQSALQSAPPPPKIASQTKRRHQRFWLWK